MFLELRTTCLWLIPNHYIKNGRFTKHPLNNCCLGYQVVMLKVKLKDIFDHQYLWDPHDEHVKKKHRFSCFLCCCLFFRVVFFPVCLLVCFVVVICCFVFVFWSWFVFVVVWLFKWIERWFFATIRDSRSVWLTQLEPFYIGLAHSTMLHAYWVYNVGGGWDNLKLFMLRCREIDSIWDCVWCWFEVSLRKTNFDTAKTIACTFPSTGVIWKHCHRSISYPRKQQQKRFFFECLHQTFSAIATSHEVRCLGPLHFINCNVWYYQCENADLLMLPMAGN